jgi:membrane protease YdiL (CAAX protease family)
VNHSSLRPHDFLDAVYRGKNRGWRYLLGITVILVCWQVLGLVPLAIALFLAVAQGVVPREAVLQPEAVDVLALLPPLWRYFALNGMFLCFLGGLVLAVRTVHRRRVRTLISPDGSVDYRRFFAAFGLWFGLMSLASLVEYGLDPERFSLTFEPLPWFVLLLTAPLLTLIQAGTEELFFRGYLLQGLGLLTRRPWVLILLSSVVFAVPHFFNPEMATNAWILAVNYLAVGMFLTLITLKDGRLELATGMHVANNLFIVLAVNYQDSALASPALVQASALHPEYSLMSTLIAFVVFYYWFFRRRTFLPSP